MLQLWLYVCVRVPAEYPETAGSFCVPIAAFSAHCRPRRRRRDAWPRLQGSPKKQHPQMDALPAGRTRSSDAKVQMAEHARRWLENVDENTKMPRTLLDLVRGRGLLAQRVQDAG